MTQIDSLEQAEQILASYIPRAREMLGKDLTLVRMKPLLEHLGNPERKLKIIHVAGTSGKTSTAYYLTALLNEAGQKTGLTVSPHLDSVTERVQLNLQPLGDKAFCHALSEFLSIIDGVEPKPTYFELLVAFAYWYFAKAEVDYAVIETGLGGSFDATNAAGKSDKICVITDIGIDHTQVLGKSITEIAGQKAGIIYPGNQVFMHQQSPDVMRVFEQATKKRQAILNVLSISIANREGLDFGSLPLYQQRNWTLAKAVYDFTASRDSLPVLSEHQLAGSMGTRIPGRMEVIKIGGKTLVLDGAHNQQKMLAFMQSFRQLYPNQKVPVLMALKEGKEHKAVLPLLKPICSQLIVTSFETAQDLPTPSINPEVLAEAALELGFDSVLTEPDRQKALKLLLSKTDDMAIITGSFYLLSSLRPDILKA